MIRTSAPSGSSFQARTLEYSKSGWTATPTLAGIVHGVVVQIIMKVFSSPTTGNLT